MKLRTSLTVAALLFLAVALLSGTTATAQQKPNIIFIMGDDVGWFNIGVYNQGMMAGRTPNLDRMAAEGMRFTDYYAEASCTAGRANFIAGELLIRTGLTTVGQAGAPLGMPDEAPTYQGPEMQNSALLPTSRPAVRRVRSVLSSFPEKRLEREENS